MARILVTGSGGFKDLACTHLCVLHNQLQAKGCRAWNTGTGHGVSVLDIKNTFEAVNDITIPFEIARRRSGDTAISCSDNRRARTELNCSPKYSLQDMLGDSW